MKHEVNLSRDEFIKLWERLMEEGSKHDIIMPPLTVKNTLGWKDEKFRQCETIGRWHFGRIELFYITEILYGDKNELQRLSK